MYARIIYYILILVMSFLSTYLIFSLPEKDIKTNNVRFKKDRYKYISETYNKIKDSNELNNIFSNSGINISGFQYQVARNSIGIIVLILLTYQKLFTTNFNKLNAILFIIIYLISSPRKTIKGYNTPFSKLTEFLAVEYRYKKDKEIYRAICQLKNLAIAKENEKLSSDYILEQLMRFTKIIKPIFGKMLSMWYENNRKEACEYFSEAIGTEGANGLSNIFMKLDDLSPIELKDQLILYQTGIKTARQTLKEKRNQRKSEIVYSIVMFSAMLVLLNFVAITLYINIIQKFQTIITN